MNNAKNKTLLLVEDEALIALAEKKLLEKEGFSVINVSTGEKAIEIISSGKELIDLILMDIDLGKGIDGTVAADIILKNHDIPVLFLTSHTENKIVAKTEEITSYGYVVKNSGITVLCASIKMAFKLFEAKQKDREQNEKLIHIQNLMGYIIEHTRSAIAVHDRDLNYMYVSRQYLEEYNVKDTNIIGKNHYEVFPDLPQKWRDVHQRVLTGEVCSAENDLYIRDDGTREWTRWECRPWYEADGSIGGIIIYTEVVTKQKQIEDERILDEARLEALLEMSRMEDISINEISDFTLEHIVSLTQSKIGFLGFIDDNETEMIVHAWSTEAMKDCTIVDKPLHFNLATSGIWSEAIKEREVTIVNNYQADIPGKKGIPDGHIKLLRLISVPVIEKGKVLAVACVGNKQDYYNSSDIRQVQLLTDGMVKAVRRIETENFLKESALKYKIVADNTYDWEFWQGPDDKFIYLSPSCKSITGYDSDNFINDPDFLISIIHPDDKEAWIQHHNLVFKEMQPATIEFRIITASGKSKWIDHVCQPVFDTEGNFLGKRGSNRDITDRKLAEDEVKRLLKEKSILLTEVHHRVKNNMNTISGLITLQAVMHENTETGTILLNAAGRVQSMMVLYDKLYRSDNENELSLNIYLPDLIKHIVYQFPRHESVEIQTQVEDIILSPKILAPLGIILNELITNSMKYAFKERESGILTLKASKIDDTISITYRDNGCGIPQSITFENSTGFGMHLVSMLVEQINGSITISIEKGTTFIIEFKI